MVNGNSGDNTHHVFDPVVAGIIRAKTQRMIHRTHSLAQDREDIEQELYLHWLECAAEFDPQSGTLRAFATTVITNRLRNYLRDNAHRRQRERCWDRFDDIAVCAADERLRTDITDLCVRLPSRLRELTEALTAASVSEVAEQRGCSRYEIYRRLKEIRSLLEEFLEIFEIPATTRDCHV